MAQETGAAIFLPDKAVVEERDPFAYIVPRVAEKTSKRQLEVNRSTAHSSSTSPRSPKEASEIRNQILAAKPSTRRPAAPVRSSAERARPPQATVANVNSKKTSEKKSRYFGQPSSNPGKQRPTTKPAVLGKNLATSSRDSLSTTSGIPPSTLRHSRSTHPSTKKSPPLGKQRSSTSVNLVSSTPPTSTPQKPKAPLSDEEIDRKFKRELLRRMEQILTILLEVKELYAN